MNRLVSRLLALLLVAVVGLTGCSAGSNLTGDYRQDTLALVSSLREAIELPEGTPEKMDAQAEAKTRIDNFFLSLSPGFLSFQFAFIYHHAHGVGCLSGSLPLLWQPSSV